VVEIANFVDVGTSIWLHREVRSDFDAEAFFEVVAHFFWKPGLPGMLTFDNDPRLVGSPCCPRFPLRAGALSLVCGSGRQCDPAASSRQKRLRGTLSSLECLRSAYRCIGQARSQRSSPLTEAFLTH
jgi:hypothetical protein